MISILIVDDNLTRVEEIKDTCSDLLGVNTFSFDTCISVQEAQVRLVHNVYDLLILDLNIPQRPGESPRRDAGAFLMERVLSSQKYVVPTHIVAITGYDDILNDYQTRFNEFAVVIVSYSHLSDSWKIPVRSKLNQIYYSKVGRKCLVTTEYMLVTVHGIRTFGEWQKRLKDLVTAYIPDATVVTYKYGYFSVLTYLLPIFREIITKQFVLKLQRLLDSSSIKPIDIVSHSFGTAIVANALSRLPDQYAERIRTVIVSGAVLTTNFDWQTLIERKIVQRVVSECGTRDLPLLINGLFVPFAGVAGLTGFSGMTNTSFVNRYFDGGHSHFFMKNGEPYDDFMERYWLPLLINDDAIVDVDERKTPNLMTGLWAAFVQNCYIFKVVLYSGVLVLIVYGVIKWYRPFSG